MADQPRGSNSNAGNVVWAWSTSTPYSMSSFLFFYRSGVVYHLLERGCSFTDKCLDVIFAYQKIRDHECESERAVDMLKDLIYTSSINAGNDYHHAGVPCLLVKKMLWTLIFDEAVWIFPLLSFSWMLTCEWNYFFQNDKIVYLVLIVRL